MTIERIGEVLGTATIAAVTGAGIVQEGQMSGLWQVLIPLGAAALVGYFSARITTESAISSLRTEIRLIREELHRYYQIKTTASGESE